MGKWDQTPKLSSVSFNVAHAFPSFILTTTRTILFAPTSASHSRLSCRFIIQALHFIGTRTATKMNPIVGPFLDVGSHDTTSSVLR